MLDNVLPVGLLDLSVGESIDTDLLLEAPSDGLGQNLVQRALVAEPLIMESESSLANDTGDAEGVGLVSPGLICFAQDAVYAEIERELVGLVVHGHVQSADPRVLSLSVFKQAPHLLLLSVVLVALFHFHSFVRGTHGVNCLPSFHLLLGSTRILHLFDHPPALIQVIILGGFLGYHVVVVDQFGLTLGSLGLVVEHIDVLRNLVGFFFFVFLLSLRNLLGFIQVAHFWHHLHAFGLFLLELLALFVGVYD